MACDSVKECACASKSCPRHKKCCECVAYHRKDGSLPSCLNGVRR